jgi:uncharacterized Ntn-hydrolase superfamily protein
MTCSIVACDTATGQLGVAVQSCVPAVGALVPWARPGVGAVASQGILDPGYGPRCGDALARGADATDALSEARAPDLLAALRQVGVVAADGSAASFTGDLCIDHAGTVVGDGFTVQANMMSDPSVCTAAAAAFTERSGPMAQRLLAALRAADQAGGDARGRMSAALLVVAGRGQDPPGTGVVVDLRVDHDTDPVAGLAHLLSVADAHRAFERAVGALVAGDTESALTLVTEARGVLPDERMLRFVEAGAHVGVGAIGTAVAELRGLVDDHPPMGVVVRSFVDKGLVTLPDGVTLDVLLERPPPTRS